MKGGWKGGGKGGDQKGRFEGACNYCWQYGHRKRACPELDKVMTQWRAKGGGEGGGWQGEQGKGKGGWQQQPQQHHHQSLPPYNTQYRGGGGGKNSGKGAYKGGGKGKGGGRQYYGGWKGGGYQAKGAAYELDGNDYGAFGMWLEGDNETGTEDDAGYSEWMCGLEASGDTTKSEYATPNPFSVLETTGDAEFPELAQSTFDGHVAQLNCPRMPRFVRPKRNKATRMRSEDLPTSDDLSDHVLMSRARSCVPAEEGSDAETSGSAVHCTSLCGGFARPREYEDDDLEENCLETYVLEEEEDEDTLDNFVDDARRMVPFKTVMDSGAGEHCCGPRCVPNLPIRPSAGSKRGQHYVAANGGRIANLGEQYMKMFTEDGAEADMVYQIAEVKRPLCSISRLCDRGNRVVFGKSGGLIHKLRSGQVTRFPREGGVYVLETMVDTAPEKPAGFTRPGR